MAEDSNGWCFSGKQIEFTDTFDKWKAINLSVKEMHKNIDYLKHQYIRDIVGKLNDHELMRTRYLDIFCLYNAWCDNNFIENYKI